jgi:hypothetical protein
MPPGADGLSFPLEQPTQVASKSPIGAMARNLRATPQYPPLP